MQPDKKSALFQGGVYADIVSDVLWDLGYIASKFYKLNK